MRNVWLQKSKKPASFSKEEPANDFNPPPFINLAFAICCTLPLLALTILGWGDWRTFFSNPARAGVTILALAGAIAYAFSGSSGLGIGRREDPSSRWIFVPLILIAVAFAWLPPHLDRLNRWTIDG
ncbi:MAG TPA: hypothetical protein VFH87_11585, partial [Candidatus Udaeobacter sp.]|nr:hypothetical protein [Candidatus Udaeobacter sp.]